LQKIAVPLTRTNCAWGQEHGLLNEASPKARKVGERPTNRHSSMIYNTGYNCYDAEKSEPMTFARDPA